jgi:undecaprenyl-diphosphatase
MSIIQSVLLGALQGLAEFLPISSSGHLVIAQELMSLSDVPLLFDILLHLATLGSVCLVFRARIASLFMALIRWIARRPAEGDQDELRLIVALIAGTAVTVVFGLALNDLVANIAPVYVSLLFIVTGIALFTASRFVPGKVRAYPSIPQALVIGLAQGIGVFPGISRSGATISAALISGVDRKAAGEFSFLLSIPVILGAFILELKSADTLSGAVSLGPLVAGMVSAFLVGYLSLKFLLGLIQKGKLGWFAFYLVPAGISLALYFALARG